MKKFLIYLTLLILSGSVYFLFTKLIFPDQIDFAFPFTFVGITLLLIFVSKFWFLFLTNRLQKSRPENWVNANLLAFTAKFILIIGLMGFLAFYIEEGAKALIIWTAMLYCLFLLVDISYYLIAGKNTYSD